MLRTLNKPLKIIAAACENMGIGYQNKLPWSCPEDMDFFRKTTLKVNNNMCQNAVIMGRKTWESIGKPLPNRVNVVITKQNIKTENHYLMIVRSRSGPILTKLIGTLVRFSI